MSHALSGRKLLFLECIGLQSLHFKNRTSGGKKSLDDLPFRGSSFFKESACNAGDTGDVRSIPASGRSPGEGNGNSLQYSCLKNIMDRGAWQATVHGVAKNRTRLSDQHFQFSSVAQSCLTLCDPIDYTVHGILQARILE